MPAQAGITTFRAAPGWIDESMRDANTQRAHWRFIGRGQGIHWPDIDEDVSVQELLRIA